MNAKVSTTVCRLLALAFVALFPAALASQDAAKPAAKAAAEQTASKWDIFLGYSYLAPYAKIPGTVSGAPGSTYGQINWGGMISFARYFNKNFGIVLEGDEHMQSEDWPLGDNQASFNSNDDMSGGAAGAIYRIPTLHFTPFVQALVGGEYVGGVYQNDTWGPQVSFGGGLDINLGKHWAWRFGQTDFQYFHVDGVSIDAFRLSTGIVYHIGSIVPPPPITLACSASPSSVYPGDPITVTATAGAVTPKLNVVYSWSGTGVTGNGTTATVATGSMASGPYTVKGEVKEGKPGKEGLRPGQTADCVASFAVKSFEAPSISCSANPTTIKPGETSLISAVGMSPQNRPLTYSYSATAGTIDGNGNSATFSSAGAPTGDVAITCNVSDDKSQTATANTSVTIAAPYIPPVPHSQALCTISFEKDAKRPGRVDNEAKACLDDIALSLQKQSDAKAVLVGESTAEERTAKQMKKHAKGEGAENLAAQRAVNTKDYLVTEKGIDASRISVATGSMDGKRVEDYLVPAGASFSDDVHGTTPVDEAVVKAQARKPLADKHPGK
jgi:hypothetical protein